MQLRFVLALLALLLWAAPTASAHRPDWGEASGVTEIADIVNSVAFYRDLTGADDVDAYVFTARAGDRLHAGINTPVVQGLEDYGASVALFGPGLPTADYAALPPGSPADLGAAVFPTRPGADFFEPFTQTNYWGRQRLEVDLLMAGTYYLVVWHPAGAAGKYVLDVGTAEVFGPGDLFQFPIWWLRVHAYFGHLNYLAAALVLLGALAGVVYLRRRAPAKPRPSAA